MSSPEGRAPAPTTLDSAVLATLADKRVFFGHQSVGENILSGVNALLAGQSVAVDWKIHAIDHPGQIAGPGLYHVKVGRNRDPLSKIAAFEDILVTQGAGARLDAAVLKLCYVDFQKDTPVEPVLGAYTAAVERIQAAHPHLRIVHTTCPLTTHVQGLKSRVRNLVSGDRYNMNRATYNRGITGRYAANGNVFDLAAVESTAPDGTRWQHRFRGAEFHSLHPSYTYDGGHLNAEGSRRAAVGLLHELARALQSQEAS